VDHRQNPQAVTEDAVDHDKGRASDDKLACSLHSPRLPKMRMIGKLFHGIPDRRSNTSARRRVFMRYIPANSFEIVQRDAAPNDLHPLL